MTEVIGQCNTKKPVYGGITFVDDDDNRIYRFSAGDMEAIERLKAEKYACKECIYHKSA